jgi:hypothetical protein
MPHDPRMHTLYTMVYGEEGWMVRREMFSKEGLVYCAFLPWELRVDMLNRQELEVRPVQDLHFLALSLSTEAKQSKLQTELLYSSINVGETVSVGAVTDGVARGYGVGIADDDTLNLQCIYSSSVQEGFYINSHPSLVLKCHEVGQQAFSFRLKENMEIVSCDYFSQ